MTDGRLTVLPPGGHLLKSGSDWLFRPALAHHLDRPTITSLHQHPNFFTNSLIKMRRPKYTFDY